MFANEEVRKKSRIRNGSARVKRLRKGNGGVKGRYNKVGRWRKEKVKIYLLYMEGISGKL